MKISIFDSLFSNSISIAGDKRDFAPTKFEWDKNPNIPDIKSPLFFTDSRLNLVDYYYKNFDCYAILIEPEELHPKNYQLALELEDKFDGIFTHNAEYTKARSKWHWYPFGGSWIVNPKITEKTRDVGIIASYKNSMSGHKLRHKVIRHLGKYFRPHVWGSGYKKFDSKDYVLSQYRFMVIIENSRVDYWFTEKLIDALSMGCIPIYWGCPSLSSFFNMDGIIQFEKYSELRNILRTTNFGKEYKLREKAIKQNYERAKAFFICEDYLYNLYPSIFREN